MEMKIFVVLTSVFVVAMAQRPGYLSGPVGYPGLASRFKDDNQASSSSPSVNNRLGESGGTTPRLPVDARGDADLVQRLNNWPREHRPFWFLNSDIIEEYRNTGGNRGGVPQQQQPNLQGRFGEGSSTGFQPDGFVFDQYDDFGNPIETRTIRPVLTRGSFAGSQ